MGAGGLRRERNCLANAGQRRTKKRRAVIAMHPRMRALLEQAHAERDAGNPSVLGHGGDTKRAFASLVVVAGGRAGTPHTQRRGVPIAHVMAVLGHTAETVQRVYGHHVPEALAQALQRRPLTLRCAQSGRNAAGQNRRLGA